MIEVYGRADSTNVQKVLWLFDELSVLFSQIDRGGQFGGLETTEYRRLNPNGRIPVIVDGPLVLWESQAILRHYARVHPQAGLFPDTPELAFRADRALDWNISTLWPSFSETYRDVAFRGMDMGDPQIRAGLQAANPVFDILAGLLAGSDYVAGPAFSIADIPLAISVNRWVYIGGEIANWPEIARWYDLCSARGAFKSRVFPRNVGS